MSRWGALNVNAATTLLVLWLVADILEKSLSPEKRKFAMDILLAISHQTIVQSHALVDCRVYLVDAVYFTMSPGGGCRGFQESIGQLLHGNIVSSWKLQWEAMIGLAECGLTTRWTAETLPLVDLIVFCFGVKRVRKSAGKHPWNGDSLTVLNQLQRVLLDLLQRTLATHVANYVAANDAYNVPVPARNLPTVSPRRDAPKIKMSLIEGQLR